MNYEKLIVFIMFASSFTHFFTNLFLYCINSPDLYTSLYKVVDKMSPLYKSSRFSIEEDTFYSTNLSSLYSQFAFFSDSDRVRLKMKTREMFYHAYHGYMDHAFPLDELNPINCSGRGSDPDRANINVNDALGNFSLSLIDVLDTLLIMEDRAEFERAVHLVTQHVSFNKDTSVQVFEATIRVLGGLLSAHVLITDSQSPFGPIHLPDYDNELLDLAKDLATRLLPAFLESPTALPYPRVNLMKGVEHFDELQQDINCLAGAGTLILEFGLLSKLTGDPVYQSAARNALKALWTMKNNRTQLFGNAFFVETMKWQTAVSGLGAGMDSFYEYLIKAYIMFNDKDYLTLFQEAYLTVSTYNREGRPHCLSTFSSRSAPPLYRNVDLRSGDLITQWIDSLQAAWPAILVLYGDIEEAICQHAFHFAIWQKYSALPERFNVASQTSEVHFYPLRPELAESTYMLYRATKSPFYLHVGRIIAEDLNKYTRTRCGFATIKDVRVKTLEDRMESFVLSETLKYLYLLFDEENALHSSANSGRYLFSTEGHLMPIMSPGDAWTDLWLQPDPLPVNQKLAEPQAMFLHSLPMPPHLLYQIEKMVGLNS